MKDLTERQAAILEFIAAGMAGQRNKELGGRLTNESVWLLEAAVRLEQAARGGDGARDRRNIEMQHVKQRLQDLLASERTVREAKASVQTLSEIRAQIAGTERQLNVNQTHHAGPANSALKSAGRPRSSKLPAGAFTTACRCREPESGRTA